MTVYYRDQKLQIGVPVEMVGVNPDDPDERYEVTVTLLDDGSQSGTVRFDVPPPKFAPMVVSYA